MTNRALEVLSAYLKLWSEGRLGAKDADVVAALRRHVPDANGKDIVSAAAMAKTIGKSLNKLAWRVQRGLPGPPIDEVRQLEGNPPLETRQQFLDRLRAQARVKDD